MPLEETGGIRLGDPVAARRDAARVPVGPGLLGRVLDGFGQPIDRRPRIQARAGYDLFGAPPGPLAREHIAAPLTTGLRAIDSLLPVGLGQRIGIFGGSGVGKSTLLGAMSRNNSADVTVIALVGERNRVVRAFLEHEMGEEGMRRSVVVVATSDRPAPLRVRACFTALAIAEYFRDEGANVLLVMDSVTRLAMAQREMASGARGTAFRAEGIHAFGFRSAAQGVRAGRQFCARLDYRILHRAGRGRRFQRAHLRRGARYPGRAYRAFPAVGRRRPLPGYRRFAIGEPPAIPIGGARTGCPGPRRAAGAFALSPRRKT